MVKQAAVYLVHVAAQQCPQHGGWLHDHGQVPVDEGPVQRWVAPAGVGQEVG